MTESGCSANRRCPAGLSSRAEVISEQEEFSPVGRALAKRVLYSNDRAAPCREYHNAGWLEGGVNSCLIYEVSPMIKSSEYCAVRLMDKLLVPDHGILTDGLWIQAYLYISRKRTKTRHKISAARIYDCLGKTSLPVLVSLCKVKLEPQSAT